MVPNKVPLGPGRGILDVTRGGRGAVLDAGTASEVKSVVNWLALGPKGPNSGASLSREKTDLPSSLWEAMTMRGGGSGAAMVID